MTSRVWTSTLSTRWMRILSRFVPQYSNIDSLDWLVSHCQFRPFSWLTASKTKTHFVPKKVRTPNIFWIFSDCGCPEGNSCGPGPVPGLMGWSSNYGFYSKPFSKAVISRKANKLLIPEYNTWSLNMSKVYVYFFFFSEIASSKVLKARAKVALVGWVVFWTT